jgi:hypothetical protein
MGNVLEEKARICGRNRCGFVRGQIPTLWIDRAEYRRNRRKQKVNKLSQIDIGGFVRARTPAPYQFHCTVMAALRGSAARP